MVQAEYEFCQEMMELINVLLQCCQKKEQLLQQEARITSVELKALQALAEKPRPMRELAGLLELSPSRITRLADGLARKNLLLRERCSEDRRLCPVAITPRGREALARGEEVLRLFQQQVKVNLKEEDRTRVLQALKSFATAFRRGLEACLSGPPSRESQA
ncbi:MAG: MarR family transcriptional regulator [Bacillota bacterium]|nr:MarR family transcriptional regulator [Bacillota bacterium]